MVVLIRSLRSLRRYIAVAMVLVYVLVAGGIPLPQLKRAPHSGEAFPCASRGCGCNSAERCWTSCCCHTLAERLAWAKENNVRPPDFALAEARAAGLDTSDWDGSPKAVKAKVAAKRCYDAKPLASAASCCRKQPAAARTCCSSHGKSRTAEAPAEHIIGWQALACHGQSLYWLAAVPTLITVDLELTDPLPLVAWLGPLSSEVEICVADVPTPPPPESV